MHGLTMVPEILSISELERLAAEARTEAVRSTSIPRWAKVGLGILIVAEVIGLLIFIRGGL